MRAPALRRPVPFLLVALLPLLLVLPAAAGDGEPTMPELARMVLHGTDAEQALVARWLEGADRHALLELFRALRAERAAGEPLPGGLGLAEPAAPAPGTPLVNLEARVVQVPAAAAATLLAAAPRPDAGDAALAYLDDEQVAAWLARIETTEGAKVLSEPRLMVYDGQKANVSVLDQVSFVQDFDVEVGMGGTSIADPIIGTLQEGLVLDLRPTVSADGRHVTVEVEGTWAQVQRPIPEFKTRIGDQEVTIQLPELAVRRTKATVRLTDGGSVLIRPAGTGGAEAEVVTLLRAQRIPADGIEPGPRVDGPPPPGR